MYVELTERRTFSAKIPGITLHGMVIESEWNNLTKFVHPDSGTFLIVMREEGLIVDGTKSVIAQLLAPVVEPGFILVPARMLKFADGTEKFVDQFYVAQRKCSQGNDGKIVIDAARAPWVNIDYYGSIKACEAVGQKLLTGEQSLSIALDITEQDINWTGGKVGEGNVYQGLHKGTVRSAQVGTYESPVAEERRWHQLSTGERIYDFAGHTWEWMRDTFHSDERGIITSIIPPGSPYLTTPPYPANQKGMGWRPDGERNWSGDALIRGGYWSSGDYAGVFNLGGAGPGRHYGSIGFRSTK